MQRDKIKPILFSIIKHSSKEELKRQLPKDVLSGVMVAVVALPLSIALAIGFSTPPYGCNLFISATISKQSVGAIAKRLVPFILAMIVCLQLFTYIPWFSLVLLGR